MGRRKVWVLAACVRLAGCTAHRSDEDGDPIATYASSFGRTCEAMRNCHQKHGPTYEGAVDAWLRCLQPYSNASHRCYGECPATLDECGSDEAAIRMCNQTIDQQIFRACFLRK